MPRDSRRKMRGIWVASFEVQAIETGFMAHAVPPTAFERFRAVLFPVIIVLVNSGELAAALK